MLNEMQREKLLKRAEELGIDTAGNAIRQKDSGEHWAVYEWELRRRIIEVERSIREHRLWMVALISAIASVISATTAIVAVLCR